MGTMISDILDLTRARLSGGIPLHLGRASLPAVCRQVVEELSVAHPDRSIVFETQGEGEGISMLSTLDASQRLAAEGAALAQNAGLDAEPRVASTVATAAEAIVEKTDAEGFFPGAYGPAENAYRLLLGRGFARE